MMRNSTIVKKIFPKKVLQGYRKKIAYLGSNTKINLYEFINIKLILIVIMFLLVLGLSNIGYILAPILSVGFYFLYDYLLLDIPIKRRANELEHEAIFFFEVLALTIESDRNLIACLEIAAGSIDNELTREFKKALKEVKLGKSLNEALNNLRKTIPSRSVDSVILNLIEANTYGNSIADVIKNQITYITDKRILAIKGEINKMPTKVSIVSVLFFLPLIILLVLAPILISYFIK